MSVTEFNYDSFYGLRVKRQAGGKHRCRYFSFLLPSENICGGRQRDVSGLE
jgi:hypothetical protein